VSVEKVKEMIMSESHEGCWGRWCARLRIKNRKLRAENKRLEDLLESVKKTKEWLDSYFRLRRYGTCGKLLSKEAELFVADKKRNSCDNLLDWCIRNALAGLESEPGETKG